jgi:REP element-mobilizing transposase RayT
MSRPLRISFYNVVYYITARGNRRDKIFYSDNDKKIFLQKMDQTFVKYVICCYANYFADKYKTIDPLFQGRYKSLLIDADNYAFTLSCYIHLNPLRAGITKSIDEYPWSSLPDYLGQRKKEICLHIALGKKSYIKKIEERIKTIGEKREIQTTKYHDVYSPQKIIIKVSRAFNLTKESVLKKQRGNLYR